MSSSVPAKHPGTIRFEDEILGTVRTEAASEVPVEVAFVKLDGLDVPVTRVTARMEGEDRIIQSFDATGRMLQSTRQIRVTKP